MNWITKPVTILRDPTVADLLSIPGVVIAGGYARQEYTNHAYLVPLLGATPEQAGDIDVFLLDSANRRTVEETLGARYYQVATVRNTSQWKSRTQPGGLDVQVIAHGGPHEVGGLIGEGVAWNTPEDVLNSFGFQCEMFAMVSDVLPRFLTTDSAIEDATLRVLRMNRITDPVRSAFRLNKYGHKGYNVTPDTVADIFAYFAGATDQARERWLQESRSDTYEIISRGFEPHPSLVAGLPVPF